MRRNYLAIAIISLASLFGAFSHGSVVSAWRGQHVEYYHTAAHGAYITSTPHYLHHTPDPNCPYYNTTSAQNDTSTNSDTQGAYEQYHYGYGRHRNYSGSYGHHRAARREDCLYYSE